MSRTTIDYGIDLGTTTSSIAVLSETTARVIPNSDGASFTPSAVWIDKKGTLRVGRAAKERFEADPENCDMEFKLRMGKGEDGQKTFAASRRTMRPEELSAEVLKCLKADVRLATGDELQAAVITVPAAFELPQCQATERAAELAGFATAPLLQEPVAAALAYGFQNFAEKAFWLVYDFGGGTFDAAVIQVRDGGIQVVNHAGDNYLGGKMIDWDIVEKKLVPLLTAGYRLEDFRRGNTRWRAAIAKLKNEAERAKIQVCRTERPQKIWIENLCADVAGETVELEYELTPADVQEIVTPYVVRSINLCRKALGEKNLSGKDLEKIIMVGGTSLIPWLRDQVKADLGAALDYTIDPVTVVAQGAAIFAGAQKIEQTQTDAPAGVFRIVLEYEPVGSEVDPPIGGCVNHPANADLRGYSIEFVESGGRWRSGKVPLNAAGVFMTELHAEKGRKSEYLIELSDARGTRVPTAPDRLSYTTGVTLTNPPLTHSVGVATASNEMYVFVEKGTPLPARQRRVLRMVREVRRGQSGDLISIPVVEGENDRADRNRLIGRLKIASEQLKRDVPAHSEVEVTIQIDASRLVTTKAYIPVLDEEFAASLLLEQKALPVADLRDQFDREKTRLTVLRDDARRTQDAKARDGLARIEREDMVRQVASLLAASEGDPDAVGECNNRLLDLKAAIDQMDDALEWPKLTEEAETILAELDSLVSQHGEPSDKSCMRLLSTDTRQAMSSRQPDLLKRRLDELKSLGFRVMARRPDFWVGYVAYLEERRSYMRDAARAEQLFAQARRAINNDDVEGLKAAVRQLVGLLPPKEQEAARGYGGSLTR